MQGTLTRNGESWRGGMRRTKRYLVPAVIAALAVMMGGCNGDLTRSNAPVTLIVNNTQTLHRIDLAGGAGCSGALGTITVQALQLTTESTNLPVDNRFNDVQLTSYRVSYVRRDGGTLVPAPFTRAASGIVELGSTGDLSNFVVFDPGALNQAPFAALLASGGGRDPETGRNTVTMDVIVEVFGQTLAGERVSGSTRFTLDFCNNCQGCA